MNSVVRPDRGVEYHSTRQELALVRTYIARELHVI
jgi:hypothetical protein